MTDYKARTAKIAQKARKPSSEPIADLLLGSDYIIYYPVIAHMLDSVPAAILLCKAWSWSRTANTQKRDGWFYWSQADITEQTGLGRRITDTAKGTLRERGLLETEVRGIPATTWWRLDKEAFFQQMRLFMDSKEEYTEDSVED
jgi:hypothetical protein